MAVLVKCDAQTQDGRYIPATYDLARASKADLANINGELINEADVLPAVETLKQWFPENADTLEAYKSHAVNHVINGVTPPGKAPQALVVQTADSLAGNGLLTECEMAVAVFLFDVVMFVIGLLGIRVSNTERINRALLRELGQDTLRGFAASIRNFNVAQGALAKAWALFSILGGLYNAGMIKAVLKEAFAQMSTWDWIKTGVIATAQLTAWFATEGVGFVAEAALVILTSEQMIEDGVKAGKTCL